MMKEGCMHHVKGKGLGVFFADSLESRCVCGWSYDAFSLHVESPRTQQDICPSVHPQSCQVPN